MLIFIFASGMVLFGLIAWFHLLEVRNKRHVILVTLVLTLVIESLLAGPASEVPIGILRPQILRQDFRPPDAVIVAALCARALQFRGDRIRHLALAWGAFIAMYVAGTAVGILNGLPVIDVLFQAKAVFYIFGGMVIGAGCDLRRAAATISRLAVPLACFVPIAFLIQTANIDLSFSTPVQRFNRLGRISNDTVTLLTLVGVVTVMAEIVRRDRRLRVGVAALVLMLAPAVGRQRASYLVVAAMIIVFGLLLAGRTWRRRTTTTGVEIGLFGIGLIGAACIGLVVTSSPGAIVAPVQDAFGGDADATSARARVSLYSQAFDAIGEQPLIGKGVGSKVLRVVERSNKTVGASAHNIILDVGMRIGLIGLALYLAALWSTARHGVGLWRRARDNVVAAMAMAGLMIVVGVMTKAMVEPALDKFRLALATGIGIGLIMAAERTDEDDALVADDTLTQVST